ncbi:MAG: biopolymer transporter ExbD [Myxococcales bacterium]|nr:biopolymer transporter ExbD [Myxococcales bacterium]
MSITIREARSLIRKATRRVPQGESISHLNITPMMDMMTILLVFMIMSASVATSSQTLKDIILPTSSTNAPPPEEAVGVVIGKTTILVEGKPVVDVVNGDVPASEKANGKYGSQVEKLTNILTKHQSRLKKIAQAKGIDPSREMTIIADRDTPYRLLFTVLYSAGKAEFQQYRMIVLRSSAE